ncbi:hypothetical protein MSG28_010931 [Choristoneura fumiferana]|uniref:Uncharacterized protein n=1 Tax=Choristoneura fumiferana TaxID=7141 RepID=A0ACC0KQE0_CHOFU|nr:hypothetical protein MSG28_010931 [Choristoneura fumiferana]
MLRGNKSDFQKFPPSIVFLFELSSSDLAGVADAVAPESPSTHAVRRFANVKMSVRTPRPLRYICAQRLCLQVPPLTS